MSSKLAWLFTMAPALGLSHPALAEPPSKDGASVTPVFKREIPNVPGKSMISVVVDYAPGGTSPPHRHAPSAFIYAYVVSGEIRSQVDDAPAKVYRAGESFFETPGAHHRVSENASDSEPARLLAVFVVDSTDDKLTTYDGQ